MAYNTEHRPNDEDLSLSELLECTPSCSQEIEVSYWISEVAAHQAVQNPQLSGEMLGIDWLIGTQVVTGLKNRRSAVFYGIAERRDSLYDTSAIVCFSGRSRTVLAMAGLATKRATVHLTQIPLLPNLSV